MYNTVILDDEPLAVKRLQQLLKKYEINISLATSDTDEAYEHIINNSINIIFLDIEMPEITGLEFAKKINPNIKIIYTTAYSNYAIESFETNVIDYLLKPITEERLDMAINKIFPKKSFISKIGNEHYKINYTEILSIEAAGKYVNIITDTKEFIHSSSLELMEDDLYYFDSFFRIHRSTIVNLDFFSSLKTDKDKKYSVKIKGNHKLLSYNVSRQKINELKRRISTD